MSDVGLSLEKTFKFENLTDFDGFIKFNQEYYWEDQTEFKTPTWFDNLR